MSGMGRDQGHERPRLRRPADPNMDDLNKRMNKMEPYGGADYGGYNAYNQHQQRQVAPRPAPNADGWSSGENHLSQQQLYQYQQQQQQAQGGMSGYHQQQEMYQHPPPPVQAVQAVHGGMNMNRDGGSWNPGASEFVPKSNLGAAARGFVPGHMPRNTSQWAYQQQQQLYQHQQQQQQQQQQPQQQSYSQQAPAQQHQAQASAGMPQAHAGHGGHQHQQQQPAPPRHQNGGYSGGGRGRGYGGNPHQQDNSVYGPRDALTDAVATLVFMPTKFDRTTMQLAEKINSSTSDYESLVGLADILVETCLKERGFQCMAGKFCDTLARTCTVSFDGATFKKSLVEKYQSVHAEHDQLLSSHANKCRSLLVFATDLYLQMKDDSPDGSDAADSVRSQLLANLLYQLFMSFLTLGKQDERNLKVVADMLKVSGEALESDEKRGNSSGQCDNMERLMAAVQSISVEERSSDETKSTYSRLIEIRQNEWKVEESEKPQTFVIPEAKPTKKGSNAIAIVQPPGEPARNNKFSSGAAVTAAPVAPSPAAIPRTVIPKNNAALTSDDQELTEEELRFMAEQMGDDASECESGAGMGVGPDGNDVGIISGVGSDMPDEVEAAFQQFLDEQIQQQQQQANGNA